MTDSGNRNLHNNVALFTCNRQADHERKHTHIRCIKDGCAQITACCISLTDTCVVHTKTYPNALVRVGKQKRMQYESTMAYDDRAVDGTTAHEQLFCCLLYGILHAEV